MAVDIPHESSPMAWVATARPHHRDWGGARDGAEREVADLLRALCGETPARALVAASARSSDTGALRGPRPDSAMVSRDPAPLVLRPSAGDVLDLVGFAQEAAADVVVEPDTRKTAAPARAVVLVGGGERETGDEGGSGPVAGAVEELGGSAAIWSAAYGDIWLRDTGPIFAHVGPSLRAAAFSFNGWGGRFVYGGDVEVAGALAALADAPLHRLEMVGEPGALDFDGEGTAIASRRCLLNTNRNPNLSERDVETILRVGLGVERVIWLDEQLVGDHTDGHVDTLVRFARPGLVVTEAPHGRDDINGAARDAVARRLDGARDAFGRPIDVVRVPGAAARLGEDGPLAASHTNYVFAPHRVVVPLYGGPEDSALGLEVLAALGEVFDDREIVGLPCQATLTGGGGFHCATCHAPLGAEGPWSR